MANSVSQLNGHHMASNAYTLGNVRGGDQQVTLPSMTQQSNLVLHTGISELGVPSPILPRNTIHSTVTPKVNPNRDRLL